MEAIEPTRRSPSIKYVNTCFSVKLRCKIFLLLFADEGRSVDERRRGPSGHAVRLLVRGARFRGLRKLPPLVAQRTLPLARGCGRVIH